MAKGKGKNGGVQNRAIYSRVSFLQQAAVLLSATATTTATGPTQPQSIAQDSHSATAAAAATLTAQPETHASPKLTHPLQGLGRKLATELRSVSKGTQIRLSPAVKHTICKYCDSVLIEGETCTSTVENQSKGGRKPWADVLVRECHACQRERRYPITAPRPPKRKHRGRESLKPGNEQKSSGQKDDRLK